MTYVGAGMICPHLVNMSLLLGAIVSWGLMWPLIANRKGDWYSEKLPESSMQGLQCCKVRECIPVFSLLHGWFYDTISGTFWQAFISIALILGDGLYNFVKIMYITLTTMSDERKQGADEILLASRNGCANGRINTMTYDEKRRNETFTKDSIPGWAAGTGYVVLAAISIGAIPQMFAHMEWYYVLLAYVFAPVLTFCSYYGAGLTDMNLAYNYGKVALFVFAAWASKDHGGVIVGLAHCGVMKTMLSEASDLMQDFKIAYSTLSSPRSMFVSQLTGMVNILALLQILRVGKRRRGIQSSLRPNLQKHGHFGSRRILRFSLEFLTALLGLLRFRSRPKIYRATCPCRWPENFIRDRLPKNISNFIRDRLLKNISGYVPLPMAMGVSFLVGGYFELHLCLYPKKSIVRRRIY